MRRALRAIREAVASLVAWVVVSVFAVDYLAEIILRSVERHNMRKIKGICVRRTQGRIVYKLEL